MALLGRRLATPPVDWKTTEEDGNLSVGLLAFVLLFVFQQPAGTDFKFLTLAEVLAVSRFRPMRSKIVLLLGLLIASPLRMTGDSLSLQATRRLPNIVIIFADDLGYADIGSFSEEKSKLGYQTPNLDRMSAEGVRLTSFYAAQAVCSASRAALLTGCYPNRIGIQGALDHRADFGINANETTIAELAKTKGYATAIFGKWHLGHHPQFLPTRHGFDEYLGLPYSNDMWPNHPTNPNYPPLPLIENEKVLELMPDQTRLTTLYTERAVKFIEQNRDRPFFLYMPHTMPHVPLHVSDKFKGKSDRGLYGDVIEEIDWSVGEVLGAIKRFNLDSRTLVIFTSDNGPWLSYGNHAGSAGKLREGKGTAFDGGVREPFIARWPGRIPAGIVSHTPAMTIDLLPTVAALIGADVPNDRVIDGRDISRVLTGVKGAASPHESLYFYWGRELHAVRVGKWKLHLPHPYRHLEEAGKDGKPGRETQQKIDLALFDLANDPGEANNVAGRHPEVIKELMKFVEQARHDLGDSLTGREGRNVRQAGRLP
jgi:arylsulfatase A-like enzyme